MIWSRQSEVQVMLTKYAAVATLFLIPTVLVEFLTGNTTFGVFADPISLAILVGSYGSGTLLARELARRWQKGFASILILGIVYGMFNEGMATGGFFDPHFYAVVDGGLENYGRWGGINVVWALRITVFHAVFSIAIPIIIVDALFPALEHHYMLGNRSLIGIIILLIMVTAIQRVVLTFIQPPINPYLFAFIMILMLSLVFIARIFPSFENVCSLTTPSNRILFVYSLICSSLLIVIMPRFLALIGFPIVDVLVILCVLLLVSGLLLSLPCLSIRQRVAVAAGAEGPVLAHAIFSANFLPAAFTLALLILAWQRSDARIL
jgi:hypothetical protein